MGGKGKLLYLLNQLAWSNDLRAFICWYLKVSEFLLEWIFSISNAVFQFSFEVFSVEFWFGSNYDKKWFCPLYDEIISLRLLISDLYQARLLCVLSADYQLKVETVELPGIMYYSWNILLLSILRKNLLLTLRYCHNLKLKASEHTNLIHKVISQAWSMASDRNISQNKTWTISPLRV